MPVHAQTQSLFLSDPAKIKPGIMPLWFRWTSALEWHGKAAFNAAPKARQTFDSINVV